MSQNHPHKIQRKRNYCVDDFTNQFSDWNQSSQYCVIDFNVLGKWMCVDFKQFDNCDMKES